MPVTDPAGRTYVRTPKDGDEVSSIVYANIIYVLYYRHTNICYSRQLLITEAGKIICLIQILKSRLDSGDEKRDHSKTGIGCEWSPSEGVTFELTKGLFVRCGNNWIRGERDLAAIKAKYDSDDYKNLQNLIKNNLHYKWIGGTPQIVYSGSGSSRHHRRRLSDAAKEEKKALHAKGWFIFWLFLLCIGVFAAIFYKDYDVLKHSTFETVLTLSFLSFCVFGGIIGVLATGSKMYGHWDAMKRFSYSDTEGLSDDAKKRIVWMEKEEARKRQELAAERQQAANSQQSSVPWEKRYYGAHCPYCGHYKVRPANWDDKSLSVAMWGYRTPKLGQNYICDNCKRMWS